MYLFIDMGCFQNTTVNSIVKCSKVYFVCDKVAFQAEEASVTRQDSLITLLLDLSFVYDINPLKGVNTSKLERRGRTHPSLVPSMTASGDRW